VEGLGQRGGCGVCLLFSSLVEGSAVLLSELLLERDSFSRGVSISMASSLTRCCWFGEVSNLLLFELLSESDRFSIWFFHIFLKGLIVDFGGADRGCR